MSRRAAAIASGIALLAGGLAARVHGEPASVRDGLRDHLYGVAVAGTGHLWAVGAFDTILHSADGGRTWSRQSSATAQSLYAVDAVDEHRAWVVGREGLILATSDGGRTWRPQKSGSDKHLFDVDFLDAAFGCAVGDWGTLLVTRDGGATWEKYDLGEDVILNAVDLVDRRHGWVAGEAGILLSTQDGGKTWERRDAGITKTLFGISFSSPERGWAVGLDALIIATEDGGETWQVRHGSAEMGGLDQVAFAYSYENPSLYDVAVVGRNGIAVGDMGAVFTSNDGGRIWKRLPVPEKWGLRWFAGVDVDGKGAGMIVGAEGARIPIRDGRVEGAEE